MKDLPADVKPMALGTDHEPSLFFTINMPVPNFPVNVNPASIDESKIIPMHLSKTSLGMPLCFGSKARSRTLSALQIMPGMVVRGGGFSGIVSFLCNEVTDETFCFMRNSIWAWLILSSQVPRPLEKKESLRRKKKCRDVKLVRFEF
jgi:hypothetical protein